MNHRDLSKAALCGEPSYIWRAGQERRLKMILDRAGDLVHGQVLENGCGVGLYMERLASYKGNVVGLEYDFPRAVKARDHSKNIINAAGENLPLKDKTFDLVLSHEVIEHMQNDKAGIVEMIRILKSGGRIIIFCPNRGYPFETHGIFWRGKYKFGNIPLVNWLPRKWRDSIAPHVNVYSKTDLISLLENLPVVILYHSIIFGAYDNLIARSSFLGKAIRSILQYLEHTPLKVFGLSHFLVLEKKN
jgi:SAM-dependent methyltransferase